MVDIRPLLFINFLMALLLVTAVVARVSENAGAEESSSDTYLTAGPGSGFQTTTANIPDDSKKNQEPQAPETTTKNEQVVRDEPADETQADDSIFAKPEVQPRETDIVASTTDTVPAVQPQALTTGKLVVRSNVYDDVVLVNGKPFGSTMLELNLSPGSYSIEVAKPGYRSWNTTVDIRRAQTRNLNARLEKYTRVNFASGVWENDVKTGEGTYRIQGQLEYQGSFVNGKFHGIGSVRYSDGTKYQGEWFEGKMRGQGTLVTNEGDTYVGEMSDDQFNGDGTLTKASGDIYTGYWIDGKLNGQGSLTTKDGLLYVGGFADNLFHGSGSLTYPDGGHYEGSFSNGLFHGKGVEVYPDGKKYVGQFIEGLYHGKGEILNPNGSKITGTFKDGKPFGKATLTTAEGEVFTARSSEPGVCYRLKSYRATECPELDGW